MALTIPSLLQRKQQTQAAQSNGKDALEDMNNALSMAINRAEMRRDEGASPLPSWTQGYSDETAIGSMMDTSTEEHLDILAFKGDPKQAFVLTMRDLNTMTRSNYATLIKDLGLHIRPVIIASDYEAGFQGVGSTFTLYNRDGTTERIAPCPTEYEVCKAAAHITLGLSSILAAYFKAPKAHGWEGKLRAYLAQIQAAQHNCEISGLDAQYAVVLKELFGNSIEYCSTTLKKQEVSLEDFTAFTAKVFPQVQKCMELAARCQVFADLAALLKWKKRLGPLWKECYFVIPTVWPVAGDNPRERMLTFLMEPSQKATHLIKMEGQRTEEEIFTTLGRIVGDRAVAHLVFGNSCPASRDMKMALSTRRDLVSSMCADQMLSFVRHHPDQIADVVPGADRAQLDFLREVAKSDDLSIFDLEAVQEFYQNPVTAAEFAKKLACCPFMQDKGSATAGTNGSASDAGKQMPSTDPSDGKALAA